MVLKSKEKEPEIVNDSKSIEYYKKYGNMVIEEGKISIGYRYDHIEQRKIRKPDGKEFNNNVTLSQPSAAVLVLIKKESKWFLVFGKQSRSPHIVKIDGKLYSKIFIEQAAGLIESNQNFQTTAIAEASQELGVKLIYLTELMNPKMYRSVSYCDEVTKLYLGVANEIGAQNLDLEENIKIEIIELKKAKEEFIEYINGIKDKFFGFDIDDATLLAMTLLFWKLDTGEINLNNLIGNLI